MLKNITLTLLGLFLSVLSFAVTIGGPSGGCTGTTATFIDSGSTGTGTWSTSNPAIATIGAATGILTAVAPGVVIVTYTVGSSIATHPFTVSNPPAAITGGPTAFCIGSTATFANATPGGTWSAYSVCSITSAGVATGTHGGAGDIYYSSGPGCAVSITVTVNTSYISDSVYGDYGLCTGASAVYTNATPGGVWSTSNPSIATISSTGVATGISSGMVTISYTVSGICGPVTASRLINVVASISAGSITGAASVVEGDYASLSSSTSGGTWTSSNTAVGTVSPYGNFTGIAPGTTIVSYTVAGCSSPVSAMHTVTVTPLNGISGNVLFTGSHYGTVKVWLIKYNAATHTLTAADSLTAVGGSSVHYQFVGLSTDSFRVKAAAVDTTLLLSGFVPTYHTASAYWNSASVIYHVSGTSDYNKDINMIAGTPTTGVGFIAGDVTMGANKGTAGSIPAVGMLIYVQNSATGAIVQQTYTNTLGHYSFSNLPVGQVYKVYPELINYATTPYTAISLTAASPSMSAAMFEQHTVSHTITPIVSAVAGPLSAAQAIGVFPNPSTGAVTISTNLTAMEPALVTVTDIAGHQLYAAAISLAHGAANTALDLSTLGNGIYLLHISSASVNYNTKVQIQK